MDKNLFAKSSGKKQSSSLLKIFNLEQIKIKNGRIFFKNKKITFKLKKLNLNSVRNEDKIIYYFITPLFETELQIRKDIVKYYGRLSGKLLQEKNKIELSSAYWRTKDFNIKINGNISGDDGISLAANFSGNPDKILYPILKKLNLSGFITSRISVQKKKGEELKLKARFKARSFFIGKEKFNNLRGEGSWNSRDKKINIKAYVLANQNRSYFTVNTEGKKTFVKIKNIPSEKTAKLVSVYKSVPFGGTIETGTIEISKENISGEVLLKNNTDNENEFNVDGLLDFNLLKKEKLINFESQRLKTEFGELAVKGQFGSKTKNINIRTSAKIMAMDGLNKYLNFFIKLDLSQWNLKQGTGFFSLRYKKDFDQTVFDAQFLGKDFFTNTKTIDSLSVNIKKNNDIIYGNMEITDSLIKAKGKIKIDKNRTIFDFSNVNGKSEKIFKILNIPSPTKGNIYGSCKYIYSKEQKNTTINGRIKSSELYLADFKFLDLSCFFESDIKTLSLKNVKYSFKDGRGDAEIFFDFPLSKYNLSGTLKGIALNKIDSLFSGLSGNGNIDFKGSGKLNIDPIKIKYIFPESSYYKNRKFSFKGDGKIFTNFQDFNLSTSGEIYNTDFKSINQKLKNYKSKFSFDMKKEKDKYQGNYVFNIKDINILAPWENNIGEISISGSLKTDYNNVLQNSGIADFSGKTIVIPDFSHAIENYSGFITFNNNSFTLESLTGTIGGGNVGLNGWIRLKDDGIENAQLNLTGNNMLIHPMNRTEFNLNADISLKYLKDKLSLNGNINALSGIWERGITEGISFYTSSKLSSKRSNIFKNLNFNLRISGKKNIKMNNDLGSITGSFDLNIQGTPDSPIILGIIEGKGGEINFSNSKFKLIKAKLLFNNRLEINPEILMESEAFVKNYRIKFNAKGTAEKIIPELKSSPPLPQPEILSLISLGELFEKQKSIEFSSQIGSTSLLSNALTEKIQKRAKKFGIDLLRIDTRLPEFTTDTSPRLTVGTALFKDILIVYSTNISGLRREVVYFQYQLSPSISLIGKRNEAGRFSVDIRFRKKD